MLQSLDQAAVRRWAATCCDALAAYRDEIDALNAFPVADQDTGSNLLAAMRAGLDAVLRDHGGDRDVPPGSTVAVLARGALMGARGNSGVILSQVLRGLAEPLIDPALDDPAWDGAALRTGLRRADELATAAVFEPVSGTVLTVLHAAAQAAAAVRSDELSDVVSAATAAAVGALADTPRQLAALAAAGVVDAGGSGLILLEALLAVVTADQTRADHAGEAPAQDRFVTGHAVLAGTRARHVTVLAEPTASTTVAELAAAQARDTGQEVVVVPAGSLVQALAAIAVHDSARRPADDLVAMTEAAAVTRRGELIVARVEALTWAGRCHPGDILGMVGDEVVLTDRDPLAAARGLVERMLSVGGELVTVLLGQDAPDGVADALIEYLRIAHPEVDVVVYVGGVPERMLFVGVE